MGPVLTKKNNKIKNPSLFLLQNLFFFLPPSGFIISSEHALAAFGNAWASVILRAHCSPGTCLRTSGVNLAACPNRRYFWVVIASDPNFHKITVFYYFFLVLQYPVVQQSGRAPGDAGGRHYLAEKPKQ